jgi:hypothetical protein
MRKASSAAGNSEIGLGTLEIGAEAANFNVDIGWVGVRARRIEARGGGGEGLIVGGEGLRISCQELGCWRGVPCLVYLDVVQVFMRRRQFLAFLTRRLGLDWKEL